MHPFFCKVIARRLVMKVLTTLILSRFLISFLSFLFPRSANWGRDQFAFLFPPLFFLLPRQREAEGGDNLELASTAAASDTLKLVERPHSKTTTCWNMSKSPGQEWPHSHRGIRLWELLLSCT